MKPLLSDPAGDLDAEVQLEALALEAQRHADRHLTETDAALTAAERERVRAAQHLAEFDRFADLAERAARGAAERRARRHQRDAAELARDVRGIGYEAATLKRSA